jgi:hypothetical protein
MMGVIRVDPTQDERTKHLEQIARHFLGDVSMSLPNLRRITEKLQSKATGLAGDDGIGVSDTEDLSLVDETFAVKSLSQNAARK